MVRSLFFSVALLHVGIAYATPSPSSAPLSLRNNTTSSTLDVFDAASIQNSNRENFARLLLNHDYEKAQRFVLYFSPPRGIENALLAQYYLSTCQPRAAQNAIQNMTPGNERNLFQAVLWSLVSVPRPASESGSSGKNGEKMPSKSAASAKSIAYNVDAGEVWADEWEELELSEVKCVQMPIAMNAEKQKEMQAKAKKLFEILPQEYLTRDFNIISLAMDVGVTVPNIRAILDRFKDQKDNPYYRRLIALNANATTGARSGTVQAAVSVVGKDTITLTSFALKETVEAPHVIDVPLLLEQERRKQ